MLAEDTTRDTVDAMNLKASAAMAADFENLDTYLTIPEKDLELFFHLAPGKTMLDVGCGWGRYVSHFIEHGMNYTGIDYSPEMIAQAQRSNPGLDFRLVSFHDLEKTFGCQSFDAIWGCCIFGGEPKARLPGVLEQMRRVLVPGGIACLVLVDYFESAESVEENEYGMMHSSAWRFEEFGQALKDAGFQIAYATHRFESSSMTFIAKKS